jgi:hypothetical protein
MTAGTGLQITGIGNQPMRARWVPGTSATSDWLDLGFEGGRSPRPL